MSLLNDAHSSLREAVTNDNLVIFAGAGISKSAGLPLWGELVGKIIDRVTNYDDGPGTALKAIFNNKSSNRAIFDVLNYIQNNNLTGHVNPVLKQELSTNAQKLISEDTPLPLHSKIWQVTKKVITPNYDQLFEACEEFKRSGIDRITNKSIIPLSDLYRQNSYLLKIHGNINEIDDIIFYESQYEAQYKNESAVVMRLRELVANHVILFLGTSMTDPYVNNIISEVSGMFSNTNAQNFIITEKKLDGVDIIKIKGDPINDTAKLLDELLAIKNSKDHAIEASEIVASIDSPQTKKAKNQLNLFPKPKPYFSGRGQEMAEFRSALDNNIRFLTIDGGGGIGKTQFVSKCIQEFIPEDKVLWFDCKPESHFDTLVTSAGYPELLEGKSKTNREKFSAFKDKLEENNYYLFLDNFQETNDKPVFKEFLVFVQEYLKAAHVIVIDRDNITSVDLTPKRIHIENIEDNDNRLKYARALIDHSYTNLKSLDDKILIKLCDELQGYPLAIDFAILLLSEGERPEDITSKIVNATSDQDISERLLNAIFSRPDATEEEKQFMRQFSVFNGSIDEEVVKAILPEEILREAPRKLQRKNLLTYSNGQYQLHPLVRAFSYKKLHYKEPLHKKIADYYISARSENPDIILEERIFYHLSKAEDWQRVGKEIEERGRNFIIQGQLDLVQELIDKLRELHISNPLFDIYCGDINEIRGKWDEAQKYYNQAKTPEINEKIKAEGMIKYAEIMFRRGDVKEALPYFEEAYEYTKNKPNLKKEQARAVNDIGLVFLFFGDYKDSFLKFQESLEIRKSIDDKEGLSTTHINMGYLYDTSGFYQEALQEFNLGLKISEQIQNKRIATTALNYIGHLYLSQGKTKKANKNFSESLKNSKAIGHKSGISICYNSIGELHLVKGDEKRSLYYAKKSLEISKEIGDKKGIAMSLSNIGLIHADLTIQKYDVALSYYFQSLSIFNTLKAKGFGGSINRKIKNIKDTIGLQKFRALARQEYDKLDPDQQAHIPITEILNEPIKKEKKVGRNDPCHCGSGKKYKQCHGKK